MSDQLVYMTRTTFTTEKITPPAGIEPVIPAEVLHLVPGDHGTGKR
jgi:hypothetical protein